MNMRAIVTFLLCLIVILMIGGGYILYNRQRALEQKLVHMREIKLPIQESKPQPQIVEKVVSTKAQIWRPIQEKVRDTVVQIFSSIAAVDLLQPYKTPAQGSICGSGFFINGDGEIITNAHVVDQAKAVWIQIPSLGKRIIDVDVIGVSPERDLALLRVREEGMRMIAHTLGDIPFLPLGDSDLVRRSDEVMALGYPLGQQSLKSTTGVVSGSEHAYIQISAPINPGNSGGPLVNTVGEVIGINSAGIVEAQNVGYAIPINDLKNVLHDLHTNKLLRKPFLGIIYNNGTEALTRFLGNPLPGGCYVVEVVKDSTLDHAGVLPGDMIYAINNHPVDIYGEMSVPWSEDKISITDYVGRLSIGQDVNLLVYRKGDQKEISVKFSFIELPIIHKVYPGYEDLDYEIFGGMVVMELTLNHVHLLANHAPGLTKFTEIRHQIKPALIITHIFPNSELYRSRTLMIGSTINEVNGVPVHSLADYRAVIQNALHNPYLTIRASDNVTRASDNVFVALDVKKVLDQELQLAKDFKYPITRVSQEVITAYNAQKTIMPAAQTVQA